MNKIFIAIVGLAATAVLGAAPIQQRALREQTVVVSAIDKAGAPVRDLTAADFVVRENDLAREVLRAEPASDPLQIMVLVDTSANMQVLLPEVRRGLQALTQGVLQNSPQSHFGLMEFGDRPNQLAPLSNSLELFEKGVNALSEHSGGGAYLMQTIVDATKALKKAEAKRPVIVIFVRESSPEFSSERHMQVEDALKKTGASLWSIVLQEPGRPSMSDEMISRDTVLGDVSTRSGGMRDAVLDRNGIQPRFAQVADRLTSAYSVVYARPESLIPPSKMEVTTRRTGVRVLAPRWTGQ
jgi:hypothetical protein